MSIVRVGMSEDSKFADGYEAIFGKKSAGAKAGKKQAAASKKGAKPVSKKAGAKKK